MTVVDVVLIVIVLIGGVIGYRQGFIASLCGLLGAVAGGVGATLLAPTLVSKVSDSTAKVAVALAVLMTGVLLGEFIGGWAGKVIRGAITWSPARALDKVLGVVGQGVALLAMAWVIAVPLASAPIPALSASIRNSVILSAIDTVAPDHSSLTERLRSLLRATGFPDILGPLGATPVVPVEAPDAALASDPVAAAVQPSVLKVRALAPSCGKVFTGTGFVIGPGKVLTNAHVVGGASEVTVDAGGLPLAAVVVDYNPQLDLAVLDVPALAQPALPFRATPLPDDADAIVVGYPGGGPYTVSPARVRSTTDIRGPDLYQQTTVEREVYLLRTTLHPGNSGGPVLATDGTVIGVVFGAAIDDSETGFALTAAQVAPTVAAGLVDTSPDSTEACVITS